MANKFWPGLTLAEIAGIDGAELTHGDGAVVLGGEGAGLYRLHGTIGDEVITYSPDVLAPTTSPGTKRWLRVNLVDEPPDDGRYYWRKDTRWIPVPPSAVPPSYFFTAGYITNTVKKTSSDNPTDLEVHTTDPSLAVFRVSYMDGHVYAAVKGRVLKLLSSDLSFVAEHDQSGEAGTDKNPAAMVTGGGFVYAHFSSETDHPIHKIDPSTMTISASIAVDGGATAIHYGQDGFLYVATWDSPLSIWKINTDTMTPDSTFGIEYYARAMTDFKGKLLVVGSPWSVNPPQLLVIDVQSQEVEQQITLGDIDGRSVSVSPSGDYVYVGDAYGRIFKVSTATWTVDSIFNNDLTIHYGAILRVIASEDGFVYYTFQTAIRRLYQSDLSTDASWVFTDSTLFDMDEVWL